MAREGTDGEDAVEDGTAILLRADGRIDHARSYRSETEQARDAHRGDVAEARSVRDLHCGSIESAMSLTSEGEGAYGKLGSGR